LRRRQRANDGEIEQIDPEPGGECRRVEAKMVVEDSGKPAACPIPQPLQRSKVGIRQ
jgi:hypothetical protein